MTNKTCINPRVNPRVKMKVIEPVKRIGLADQLEKTFRGHLRKEKWNDDQSYGPVSQYHIDIVTSLIMTCKIRIKAEQKTIRKMR
jgi:hypothetical protein